MKSRIINIVKVLITIIVLTGCNKDILVEKPPHLITSGTLYTNLAGFETGLNGIYALVRQIREGVGQESGHSLRGAMFMHGTDNSVTNHQNVGFCMTAQLWKGNNNAADQELKAVFEWLYRIVNAANTVIDHAEMQDVNWFGGGASELNNKMRVISEARAIRAWAYRHLTYGWGDVPLSLNESLGSNIKTDWERTPVDVVRKQIISDLRFAEQNIPDDPSMRGRITKGAIQHYLAEMYLVEKKPDSTLYWANQAINNPKYKLVTQRFGINAKNPGSPFMDMFYDGNSNREEGNSEALWVFQFADATIGGGQALMRRYHISRYWNIRVGDVVPFQTTVDRGGLGYGRLAFTKWALELYEPNDDRGSEHAIRKFFILKDAQRNSPASADRLPAGYHYGDTLWLNWKEDITYEKRGRFDWPFSRKFDNGTDINNPSASFTSNDQVFLRLAETYLLKAEAQMLLGSIGDAAETINIIRRRSNASEISASDINLDFILDERSRELFLEEDRRHTLLRTGKWLERTRLHNNNGGQNIAERDKLYPIPQSVIDANLKQPMPQNPGYN